MVATRTFTYDGVDVADLGVIMLDPPERAVMPTLRTSYGDVPGRYGAVQFDDAYGDRVFKVRCGIVGDDYGDVVSALRSLTQLLAANPGRRPLVFTTDESDRTWMAAPSDPADVGVVQDLADFTLTFRADPFSLGDIVTDDATVADPGTGFSAIPIIEVTGNTAGFTLSLGGRTFTYDFNTPAVTISSLRYWVYAGANVDTDVLGIYDTGPTNLIDNFSGDFLVIPDGGGTISTTGGVSVAVSYRPRSL